MEGSQATWSVEVSEALARYAEQLARTRISIFRDFRFHRAVLDESYLMPYTIADTVLTENLKGHMAGAGQLEHPSRASASKCIEILRQTHEAST